VGHMRDIRPINNSGSIQLKFTVSGKRYSLNPVPRGEYRNKRDLSTAKAIATRIQNDILAGCFDTTLTRYKTVTAPSSTQTISTPIKSPVALWDDYVASLDVSTATIATRYRWVRRMLDGLDNLSDPRWFTESEIGSTTYRDRLVIIKAFTAWAYSRKLLLCDPYATLKPRPSQKQRVKPFTTEEIIKILEGFHRLCPPYLPFVSFLFMTGCRSSEAVGLRWQHIDFDRAELTISESMPIDRNGNGYTKIRKGTKTDNVRCLRLSEDLISLLQSIKPDGNLYDILVFQSPAGKTIDIKNFRKRQWEAVLEEMGIPYRKPYATRHTNLSHAIEQGTPLTGVAYLAGHRNTRMVMETYGHMINRPDLPHMPSIHIRKPDSSL
jgi:integrase